MNNTNSISYAYLAGYYEGLLKSMLFEATPGVKITNQAKFQDWLKAELKRADEKARN